MSSGFIRRLLQPVGVARMRSAARRTERLPEVPGVNPIRESHLPNLTSSRSRSCCIAHPLLVVSVKDMLPCGEIISSPEDHFITSRANVDADRGEKASHLYEVGC